MKRSFLIALFIIILSPISTEGSTLLLQSDNSQNVTAPNPATNSYVSASSTAIALTDGDAGYLEFYFQGTANIDFVTAYVFDETSSTNKFYSGGLNCQTGGPEYWGVSDFSSLVKLSTTTLHDNGGGFNIEAGHNYTFYFIASKDNGSGGCTYFSTASEATGYSLGGSTGTNDIAFSVSEEDNPLLEDTDTTRIIWTEPFDGELTSTSTTFGIEIFGYVNENDYETGTKVTIKLRNDAQNAYNLVGPIVPFLLTPNETINIDFTQDLGSYGYFDISTTTDIQQVGKYTMTTKIIKPSFSLFGYDFFPSTIVTDTIQFKVATSTAYDDLQDIFQEETSLLDQELSSDCDNILTSLSIPRLVSCLFVPSTSQIENIVNQYRTSILVKAPFGYVTRMYDIMDGDATSTFPVVSYTFPDSVNYPEFMRGETLSFDPFGDMASEDALINQWVSDGDDPQTAWQIVGGLVDAIVYMELGFLIIREILSLHRRKEENL